MTNYAYYCFHKLKLLPSQFDALPIREKAMVIAFIKVRIAAEERDQAKLKKAGKRR